MAKEFLRHGDYVVVVGYHDKNITRTIMEFKQYKDSTLFIKCDITNEKNVIELFENIRKRFGVLDILINNAAFDEMHKIEKFEQQVFNRIIETNLSGKMLCIKHSIELLKKSKYPSIINIASRLASRPMKDSSAYCCSAAGIVMLSKCAALELSEYGIRVNTVSPSLTITPLAEKSYTELEIEDTRQKNPRKRLCEMKDIFNVIDFLVSENADYINGENINVNGGLLLK